MAAPTRGTSVEETTTTTTTTEELPEVKSANAVQQVNCLGIQSHNCTIGDSRYIVEEKKPVTLPEDVAMILQNAGVVIRLK
jgi:hypothetical protein